MNLKWLKLLDLPYKGKKTLLDKVKNADFTSFFLLFLQCFRGCLNLEWCGKGLTLCHTITIFKDHV